MPMLEQNRDFAKPECSLSTFWYWNCALHRFSSRLCYVFAQFGQLEVFVYAYKFIVAGVDLQTRM